MVWCSVPVHEMKDNQPKGSHGTNEKTIYFVLQIRSVIFSVLAFLWLPQRYTPCINTCALLSFHRRWTVCVCVCRLYAAALRPCAFEY